MRLIGLAIIFSVSLILEPLAVAQQAVRVPRVGFLSDTRQLWGEGFKQGLRELGYVAGKSITIEYRYGEGKLERLSGLAAELVRLNVDVIVAGGTQAVSAAKESTNVIPIVMALTADPVGNGFVASLARPAGNITGLTSLSRDLSGKRLELRKEIVPRLRHVAVRWNSGNPDNAAQLREAESVAHALGVASLLMWKIERRSSGIPSIAGRDRHRRESRQGGYQGIASLTIVALRGSERSRFSRP